MNLETSPTIYNTVSLRMWSAVLTLQPHLQGTAQKKFSFLHSPWTGVGRDEETELGGREGMAAFSLPRQVPVRGMQRDTEQVCFLLGGCHLTWQWCLFAEQVWTFRCVKESSETGICSELKLPGTVAGTSMIPLFYCSNSDFCQGGNLLS